MDLPWTSLATAVALLCCVCVIPTNATNTNYLVNVKHTTVSRTSLAESAVMERLADLNLPVEVRYTPTVRSRIRQYLVEGSRDSEIILGRTAMYFPVFEHYLRLYRLPEALKYLPIVESTLRARATSHAGASGLWQFVPATARSMGLKVNGTVDERLDTYRATEAAVKMLAALHKEFGDWGIALTAYNCGPGNVRQAIRLAGRRDYWAIQRYLPRETQRYVPAFIAAAYLVNYYQHHGLHPDFPVYDLQETRVFRVYMPLVEPGDVGAWFKEVDRYVVETEDGKGSLRFALQGGALTTDTGPPPSR